MLRDDEVFALTDKGDHELHRTGTALTPAELEVLVLVDGKAPVSQIERRLADTAPQAVRTLLQRLVRGGFVAPMAQVHADAIDAGDFFTSKLRPAAGPGAEHAEADETHSGLRTQGYYVRISRRARKARGEGKINVLAVDDDPDIGKLLVTYLGLEGFGARVAGSRAEIVAALRQPPPPDVVLLDVTLPDVDGFEVLARMRQHPVLNSVPVIMLTARATREAVLKGLHGGADGYLTKPFQVESLIQAVRVVLGLSTEASGDPFAGEKDDMERDYRRRLPERLARIEEARQRLAQGTAPAEMLAELHRELHSLAGSAKMYGLPGVSEAARAAEAFVETCRDAAAPPGAREWAGLRPLLEKLRHAASE